MSHGGGEVTVGDHRRQSFDVTAKMVDEIYSRVEGHGRLHHHLIVETPVASSP
jgi:hypothetical protein